MGNILESKVRVGVGVGIGIGIGVGVGVGVGVEIFWQCFDSNNLDSNIKVRIYNYKDK